MIVSNFIVSLGTFAKPSHWPGVASMDKEKVEEEIQVDTNKYGKNGKSLKNDVLYQDIMAMDTIKKLTRVLLPSTAVEKLQ
jgi:hypothetical protein